MNEISQDLLEIPIEGVNLTGETLADQIGDRPTLLIFLRHFG